MSFCRWPEEYTTLTRTVQARIKQTMQTWRRRMDASAQTHRHVSTDAYMRQTTRQAGKDFSFVMRHYSFALCGIVMLNKINSQVWGSPIIPCLNKRMKDKIEINLATWVLLLMHLYARRAPAIFGDLKIRAYILINSNCICVGINEWVNEIQQRTRAPSLSVSRFSCWASNF